MNSPRCLPRSQLPASLPAARLAPRCLPPSQLPASLPGARLPPRWHLHTADVSTAVPCYCSSIRGCSHVHPPGPTTSHFLSRALPNVITQKHTVVVLHSHLGKPAGGPASRSCPPAWHVDVAWTKCLLGIPKQQANRAGICQ